jgi:hypothetical protein
MSIGRFYCRGHSNSMNVLTEHGGTAGPSRSTELRRGDQKISNDCGVDDRSGGKT